MVSNEDKMQCNHDLIFAAFYHSIAVMCVEKWPDLHTKTWPRTYTWPTHVSATSSTHSVLWQKLLRAVL